MKIGMGTIILCLWALGGSVYGVQPIEGDWQNVDDETGVPKAIITIWVDSQGNAFGKIRELLNQGPNADPNPPCTKCTGADKDRRAKGLVLMRNLRQDGDVWTGGSILDPNSGKIYRCRVKLNADGKRLEVRGFIGISLIGRTQVWYKLAK